MSLDQAALSPAPGEPALLFLFSFPVQQLPTAVQAEGCLACIRHNYGPLYPRREAYLGDSVTRWASALTNLHLTNSPKSVPISVGIPRFLKYYEMISPPGRLGDRVARKRAS
jgi:hypothetical protein